MQTQIKTTQSTTDALGAQRKEFQELATQEVPAAKTKKVKVYTEACCGCGCDTIWLYREVPVESALSDGSYISPNDVDWNNDEFIDD